MIVAAAGVALFWGTSLHMHAQSVILHTFTGAPDGANPLQLVFTNGIFYGATANGGASDKGSIFSYNTNGSIFTTIYSFTGGASDGSSPNNILVAGNKIYGTTSTDGTNSVGTVFAVGTNGTGFTPLYSFAQGTDGHLSQGGLIISGATLYGTTTGGGATTNGGTVFKINTNGTGYAILHSFTNASSDGTYPQGELVLGGNTLYGITKLGGASGLGTIYAINTDGTAYTVLHSFTNNPDGAFPYSGLVLNAGVLYGASQSGGANTNGAIYTINPNGNGFRVLYSFSALAGNTDGRLPVSILTVSGGCLYGTTTTAGSNGGGTLFTLNTNGSGFTVVVNFTNNSIFGYDSFSGPLRIGSSLWGTTRLGNPGAGTFGTLYRIPMPAILQQPQGQTVNSNSPATFTVTVADEFTLSYQWYLNTNTLLVGQTTNVLNLASATNNGTYTVVVSDGSGSVTSAPAVLNVVIPGAKPTITQNPQAYAALVGSAASFTNAAVGTSPLFYQWYFNTNTLLAGQTGTILTISSVATTNDGYYTVVVTNVYGSATSSPARLTVTVPVGPTIAQQPQNYTVNSGSAATFTNAASGTGQLFYQWYFNTNTPVNGGTGPILTIPSATTNDAGYYRVIVTNLYGSATSVSAKLTVNIPVVAPAITQQPQNYTVTNGYNATFTNVASGTAPLFYQWYFNTNTAIVGGTNYILTVTFVSTNDIGSYRVIVTNTAGSVTSSPASLAVISTKPIIFQDPQPLTVTNGAPFSFTVVAAGKDPMKYQWYTNSVTSLHGLIGKTNSTVSYAAASNRLGTNWIVVITNSLGAATSSPALLTVLTKPVIAPQPQSVVVTNGDPAIFTAGAAGPGALAFQWFFRTNTVLAGATNTSLVFTNAITNLAGYYSVRVTNGFGSVTSSYALLTVSNRPNFLSFTFDPASGSPSFAFANIARSTNRLWASTNLASAVAWQVIASNVMATNGLWFYTDPNATKTNNARFYRFSTP